MKKPRPEVDPNEALARLLSVKEALSSIREPADSRMRISSDNARKEFTRQIQGVTDELVVSLLQRAMPIFLCGGTPKAQKNFVHVAKNRKCMIVDADAAYAALAREVGVKCSVVKIGDDDNLVALPARPRMQLNADMINWIVEVTTPSWSSEEGSHYGRLEALSCTLLQPAPVLQGLYFEDWAGLVALIKAQYRQTNPNDTFGKIAIQDQLRTVADLPDNHVEPIVVIRNVESGEEAQHLSFLFSKKPLCLQAWPDKVDAKFVDTTINEVEQLNK